MAIKTEKLSGPWSFRGLGYVEINGALMPVCGSCRFDLGLNSTVRYIVEQVEKAKPEEERNAIFPVRIAWNLDPALTVCSFVRAGIVTAKSGLTATYVEGLPGGLSQVGDVRESLRLMAPFRWILPPGLAMESPEASDPTDPRPLVRYIDDKSPAYFPESFDSALGASFDTEIFIP